MILRDTRLVRDGDTLTLSFQTSERLSTSSDVDGTREPLVYFLQVLMRSKLAE